MTVRDKILVVEDDKNISSLIRTILTANGYEVITAGRGSEALSMLSSHCPELLVLDLGLPDMDGVELIQSVRRWSNVPIIVVSARSYERDKVQALDLGADDYVTKPFSAEELLARVRYFVVPEDQTAAVPYGFRPDPVSEKDGMLVFESDCLLSEAFSYDSFITRQTVRKTEQWLP